MRIRKYGRYEYNSEKCDKNTENTAKWQIITSNGSVRFKSNQSNSP